MKKIAFSCACVALVVTVVLTDYPPIESSDQIEIEMEQVVHNPVLNQGE